ncbi:MAG: D-Ala-D-Ala carboxypeptidase family metallohydrolase [Gemmatimonadaceae bacterium]
MAILSAGATFAPSSGALLAAAPAAVTAARADTAPDSLTATPSDRSVSEAAGVELRFLDSLVGRSGKLRARFLGLSAGSAFPALALLFGDTVATKPGLYALRAAARPFAFITKRPFADKIAGRVGAYRMGYWPFERRAPSNAAYANPEGFIEVTAANQDTYVSEHFRLRDFLTHDQQAVWPKYLVLDERLLDKLELMIAELEAAGIRASHVSVMSGFRTPQYNAPGVRAGGRAATSRHQYGDAADVFVDNDRNGRMDDLNRDGRVDTRDAAVLLRAVERVERTHPELIGGVGVYPATRAHGPFAHIDARGHGARWGEE